MAPEHLFQHMMLQKPSGPIPEEGAVVCFPAGHNEKWIPELNALLRPLQWVVLILNSDEESSFPWHRVTHPNMRIWIQTPHPKKHANESLRYLPLGAPRHGWELLSERAQDRKMDIYFHGQVNHLRRDEMVEAFSGFPGAYVDPSPGFTQGVPRETYLNCLSLAKVVLAPSGPSCPDTFRCWEALEAGAVPIVDVGPKPDALGRAKVGYPPGYWKLFDVPFPDTIEWSYAPSFAKVAISTYPDWNNMAYAWWQRFKLDLRNRLIRDIEDLSGRAVDAPLVTILVPTSPTPNNPDTSHVEETLSSIRSYPELEHADIFLMIDGVRGELSSRADSYAEYVQRLLWLSNFKYRCYPMLFNEHLHQSGMLRETLPHVRTPLMMFVEHDTPLVGAIEWDYIFSALIRDEFDLIRLYHEAVLQEEHKYLMLDADGKFIKTVQWSQRPHVAWTDYYAKVLGENFSPNAKTMIEDHMHGIAQNEGWISHRLAIYAPNGDLKHSTHLDARGEDSKFEESFTF